MFHHHHFTHEAQQAPSIWLRAQVARRQPALLSQYLGEARLLASKRERPQQFEQCVAQRKQVVTPACLVAPHLVWTRELDVTHKKGQFSPGQVLALLVAEAVREPKVHQLDLVAVLPARFTEHEVVGLHVVMDEPGLVDRPKDGQRLNPYLQDHAWL